MSSRAAFRMSREQLHALGYKPGDGKGGVVSVEAEDLPPKSEVVAKPQIRMPRRREPNATEARWKTYQFSRPTHPIPIGTDFKYEFISFYLPSGTRYTPDWSLWFAGHLLACVEVKGPHIHSSRSIHAFKEACAAMPFIRFIFAQWDGEQWLETVVPAWSETIE